MARICLAWALLCGAACRIDQLESETELSSASVDLELTSELGAPPPRVRVLIELSDFARAQLVALELHVAVEAGQGLAGQGLSAEWIEGATGASQSSFGGSLQNELTLIAQPSSVDCVLGPCHVEVELSPRGSWQRDVPYPLRYGAYAVLTLERRDRLPLTSDLEVRLELLP